jgi:flagellar basal-body rod modification protein FlgD
MTPLQSLTAAPPQSATDAALQSTSALGDATTFLQLLVAQIQNQDPTQPMDSSTFVTQLAQFSQLEQLISIRQNVQQLNVAVNTPATTSTTDGN